MSSELISLKKYYKDLKALDFHLQCLEDSRQVNYNSALEQFTGINNMDEKIKSHRMMTELEEHCNKTELAIEESIMLEQATIYIAHLQVERLRIGLQTNQYNKENEWLTRENKLLKARIIALHEKITTEDTDMQQSILLCQIRENDIPKAETKVQTASVEKDIEVDKQMILLGSSQIKAFYPLAIQYINSGRIELATSLCIQSKKGPKLSAADEGLIAYILGLCAIRKRDGTEALKYTSTSLKLITGFQGKETLCIIPILIANAKALRLNEKFADAEGHLMKALKLRETLDKTNKEAIWNIKVDIASCQLNMGRANDAAPILLEILETASSVIDKHDPLIIRVRNYIARCYVELDQIKEANLVIENLLKEVFSHDAGPSVLEVVNNPKAFNVENVGDLVSVCQLTNSILELFTYQTLVQIFQKQKKLAAADLINEYVTAHSIYFQIE